MLEELWNGILELTAQFVIPDWGALIALLPVFIFVLTIVILVAMFLRLFRAPKARRGKARRRAADTARAAHAGPVVVARSSPRSACSCCSSAWSSRARSWCSEGSPSS